MADYIDREKLLNRLTEEENSPFYYYEGINVKTGIKKAKNVAELIPSIDAVEVVRCRDCRFFDNPLKTERGVCTYGRHIPGRKMSCSGFGTTINDYCSRGEKE